MIDIMRPTIPQIQILIEVELILQHALLIENVPFLFQQDWEGTQILAPEGQEWHYGQKVAYLFRFAGGQVLFGVEGV